MSTPQEQGLEAAIVLLRCRIASLKYQRAFAQYNAEGRAMDLAKIEEARWDICNRTGDDPMAWYYAKETT